jgi:hypothetical protein
MEIKLAAIEYNVRMFRERKDLAALWKIRKDPNLSADGRMRMEADHLPGLTDRFYEIREANETLVEGARKEYRDLLPAHLQRRASFRAPKRAMEIRDLASSLGVEGIEALIEDATSEKDLAAAFGLRMAAQEVEDEQVRGRLIEQVDQIGSEGHEERLALLLAVQAAAAEFETRGPDQDPNALLNEPAKSLTLNRRARAVPAGVNGDEREVSSEEAGRLAALLEDS